MLLLYTHARLKRNPVKGEDLMYPKRTGIAIWLKSTKHARQLRRYGVVHYVSKSMNYAIVYCDETSVESVIEDIKNLHFVEKAERSMKPSVATEYKEKTIEKEPVPDYNMGL